MMFCNKQNRLLLQFHITGKCNLRCKHCYRKEGDVERFSFRDIITVIEQFKSLLKRYNSNHRINKRGHINITGGEPFFRSDIKEILSYLGDNKELFSYGILSNGSFIDEEIIRILKETQVSFVQLSIDGTAEIHNQLRAPGDYQRVFSTASYLESNGVRTYISFTANKSNFHALPHVARECRKRNITKLWSDRLVPIGNGEALTELAITQNEIKKYIRFLKRAQGNFITKKLHPKTQVTMNRALQFIGSDGAIYSCSAGDSLITVDETGNIMPCRRMPVLCGNVFESTLEEVYYNSPVFQQLRMEFIPTECEKCKYTYLCRGGAKCQSYAVLGSFNHADPACNIHHNA